MIPAGPLLGQTRRVGWCEVARYLPVLHRSGLRLVITYGSRRVIIWKSLWKAAVYPVAVLAALSALGCGMPVLDRKPAHTPGPPLEVGAEVVAENLEVPWALAFAPDGRLFFTERPGRLRVIENGQLRPEPVATFDVASVGEAGLLGLALDPDFASNRLAYVYHTYRSGDQLRNRVVRFVMDDNGIKDVTAILDGIPGANIHDGGRIKFGPDGKLYVTTGDATESESSQDVGSLAGKILRINSDGSVPANNPFANSPVFTLGHRNSQGISWHPVTGQMFATEHGPVGRDEVNIIERGQNYGWPKVAGFGDEPQFVNPIVEYTPAIAPAGAAFFTDGKLFGWNGDLFFACLRGQQLRRLVLASPDYRQVQSQQVLFQGEFGRLRALVLGPDGLLYFSTSNRDGRGDPAGNDDRILRIVPR